MFMIPVYFKRGILKFSASILVALKLVVMLLQSKNETVTFLIKSIARFGYRSGDIVDCS